MIKYYSYITLLAKDELIIYIRQHYNSNLMNIFDFFTNRNILLLFVINNYYHVNIASSQGPIKVILHWYNIHHQKYLLIIVLAVVIQSRISR